MFSIQAQVEQVKEAKKFIKKLVINFDSQNFENPALQHHYQALQAMALERQFEKPEDYVQPDLEGMKKVKFFFFFAFSS